MLLLLLIDCFFWLIQSVLNFLSGDGDLTFSFNLYLNGGNLVTTDYTIDLETLLYGELSVATGGFSGLDVHFEELTAVSSSGDQYTLILNG